MSNFINIQRKLSEGLYAWMLYEFSCNRGYNFNEKYISYPIVNLLMSNLNSNQNILVEQNHPSNNDNPVGRPLQVDYVVANKYKSPLKWEIAIESKWIGNSTIKFHDLIFDLIRLQNLFSHFPEIKCYFMIAGDAKKIKEFWEKQKVNKLTKKDIILEGTRFTTFKLNNLKDRDKDKILDLPEKYKKLQLFEEINCGAIYRYPVQDINNMSWGTLLFEINPPRTAQTLAKKANV